MTEKTMNAYDTNNFQNMHTENEIYEYFSRNNDRYHKDYDGDDDYFSEMDSSKWIKKRKFKLVAKNFFLGVASFALATSLFAGATGINFIRGYCFSDYDVANVEKVENGYELTYIDGQKETYTMEELAKFVGVADITGNAHAYKMPDGHTASIGVAHDTLKELFTKYPVMLISVGVGLFGPIIALESLPESQSKSYSKRR